MADSQQVKATLQEVEVVNHPIVSDTDAIRIQSFHPMVGMFVECLTQAVNHGLDSELEIGRQLEEIRVEVSGVDLQRRTHWPSGWRVRE